MNTQEDTRMTQDFSFPTETSDGGVRNMPTQDPAPNDGSGDAGFREAEVQRAQGITVAMSVPAADAFKPVVSAEETAELQGQVEMTYYKGPMGSFKYAFKNGESAHFVNFVYATRKPSEIAELDKDARHIGLTKATGYIDVQELVDPTLAFRNKIIREYLATQSANSVRANNPNNQVGDYAPGRAGHVGAASTRQAISADVAMSNVATEVSNAAGPKTFEIPGATASSSRMAELLAKIQK